MKTGLLKWQSSGEGEGGGSEGRGPGSRGRGQSAKFVQRKTLTLCIVWKMTCFPGPDGRFFRVLLAFSDWTDFARVLLLTLELGAPGSYFLTSAGWHCCSGGGGMFRVSGTSSSLCFWGNGKRTPGSQSHHSIKTGESWLSVWILFVVWKTDTSTELSTNRCCRWLDPGSCRLCWKQGRLFYSRSALLSCQLRMDSRKIMSYVY